MNFKNKTAVTDEFVCKLYYRFVTLNDEYVIHIQAVNYDRNSYLIDASVPPLSTETNFVSLPQSVSHHDAKELFNEIAENLVFPISLDYIMEDFDFPSPNGANYRMINKDKISAKNLISAK